MNGHDPFKILRTFGLILALGLLVKAVELGLQLPPGGPVSVWLEHISIALMVAGILGLTIEYVLYEHRLEAMRSLLQENREKVFEALKAYGVLMPEGIFRMLKDIASQTDEIPTLYSPPREEAKEYTFSESVDYFDSLVEVRRKEITEILRTWVEPKSHINVKFLASDFIGRYQLKELAPELHVHAWQMLQLGALSETDRSWVLNYLWAASRCELPMYKSLGALLRSTNDEKIAEWILFVPLQMPSSELGEIVEKYLDRQAPISTNNLKQAIRALAKLKAESNYDSAKVFKKFAHRFDRELLIFVEQTWRQYALAPEELGDIASQIPLSEGVKEQKHV